MGFYSGFFLFFFLPNNCLCYSEPIHFRTATTMSDLMENLVILLKILCFHSFNYLDLEKKTFNLKSESGEFDTDEQGPRG